MYNSAYSRNNSIANTAPMPDHLSNQASYCSCFDHYFALRLRRRVLVVPPSFFEDCRRKETLEYDWSTWMAIAGACNVDEKSPPNFSSKISILFFFLRKQKPVIYICDQDMVSNVIN